MFIAAHVCFLYLYIGHICPAQRLAGTLTIQRYNEQPSYSTLRAADTTAATEVKCNGMIRAGPDRRCRFKKSTPPLRNVRCMVTQCPNKPS